MKIYILNLLDIDINFQVGYLWGFCSKGFGQSLIRIEVRLKPSDQCQNLHERFKFHGAV